MLDVAATIVDWGESRHVHGNRDPENPGRVESLTPGRV